MIYKFYKKEGETMGKMLESFKSEYAIPETEKVTYSGRLDPLASGEVLILTGEDVYKKDDFNKRDKIYSFTIMFGISTDTGDILGVPNKQTFLEKLFHTRLISLSEKSIKNVAKSFIKTYTQNYPAYSSYNINGVPMWELARKGELPKKLPKNKITIYDLQVLSIYKKTSSEVLNECKVKVGSVDGDFRQGFILQGWGDVLENKNKQFIFADMRATVSSGTYIRTLCGDIGKKLCTPALAYKIEREEIL